MNGTIRWMARYDESGASSRLRVYQVARSLEEIGWRSHIDVLAPFGASRLRSIGGTARRIGSVLTRSPAEEVLVLQKEAFRPDVVARLVAPTHWRRRPMIWDVDDAVWLRGPSSLAVTTLLLETARLVVAGNPAIARFAAAHGAEHVVTIPTGYEPTSPVSIRSDAAPTIGWIGSAATSPYLDMISADLLGVLDAWPQVELKLMGATVPESLGRHPRVMSMDWSRQAESGFLDGLTLAINPLPSDGYAAFKSGYKLIQYGRHGVPTVTSPTPIVELFPHGTFDVVEGSGWFDALGARLDGAEDDASREARSECTAALASADAVRDQWAAAIEQVR